jgi:hypothetical protein
VCAVACLRAPARAACAGPCRLPYAGLACGERGMGGAVSVASGEVGSLLTIDGAWGQSRDLSPVLTLSAARSAGMNAAPGDTRPSAKSMAYRKSPRRAVFRSPPATLPN